MILNICSTVTEADSCHPFTTILFPRVSIASAIRPGYLSAIRSSHSGSLIALVPSTTLSTPALIRASTVSSDLIPPPASTGTPE